MDEQTPTELPNPASEPTHSKRDTDPVHAGWRGFVKALERQSDFHATPSALAPWEMLLDPRMEAGDAVAAVRDWSRVHRLVAQLPETRDPEALSALLRDLEMFPDLSGEGVAQWLTATLPATPKDPLPAGLSPINLHRARTLLALWLGRQIAADAPGETVAPLLNALLWMDRLHDIRTDTALLCRALEIRADAIDAKLQVQAGDNLASLPFAPWLQLFGRVAQEDGIEGRVNSLSRYEACLLSGFLHNGLGIPITLCAVVQYILQRIAARQNRPLRVRGLNTPGHFLLLADQGGDPLILDPFRGVYDLTWKSFLFQTNAREMTGVTPDNLVAEQPADILPRMTLNAIKRLENRHEDLRAAEYCTLHFELSHDPHVLLQRGLLRLRTPAKALGIADLQAVMQSEDESAAKLAQKFMMREDFFLAKHPN